jgi:hypothetical protein
LMNRDDTGMLGQNASSVSIRIEVWIWICFPVFLDFPFCSQWPGYQSWNRQVRFLLIFVNFLSN